MANPWFPPNGVSALSPPRLTTGDSSILTPPIPPDPPDPDFPPLGSVPPKSPRFSSQTGKPSRPATKSFTPKTAAGSKLTGPASSSTSFSKSTVSNSGSSAPLNFKILQPKHSSPIQTNKASSGSTIFPTNPSSNQNPKLIATKTQQTQSASQKGKNVPSETPTSKKPEKTTSSPSSTTFLQASTSSVPPNPDPPAPPIHSQPPKTPTQKNATPLASSHLLAVIPSPSKSPPDTFITPSLKRPRAKMNVRGIEDSNIVITSNCVHARCSKIFVRDCWCCPGRVRKCWKDEASCDAICPRPPK
ncbi:hypothetical protein YC2023_058758 [Brassica napus]